MSTIKIENRGKNLITNAWYNNLANLSPDVILLAPQKIRTIVENARSIDIDDNEPSLFIPVKPNTTYTLSFDREIISHDGVGIYELIGQKFSVRSLIFYRLTFTTINSLESGRQTITFTTDSDVSYIILYLNRCQIIPGTHSAIVDYSNFQLEEGDTATEYEPPRSDYIEFDTELFGYNGVYDELRLDGVLVKRWQRESITITSGAGTVSKNGTGTCILVADSDGVPYEGTVSDTDVNTSAPEGTYTIIYQLATPEISTLYLPEKLKLYSSDNNIIIEGGTGVLTTDANIEYHL